jgi:hypothetical protein
MRSAIPFDTHAYIKKLVAAGVPEEQAEVHAEFWAQMVLDQVATKDDLIALEERIMTKVDVKLKELELRITLRVGGMLTAFAALMTAVVKFL